MAPSSTQAMAVWHWYNYVTSRIPPGKEVLRLNLDETSVCLYQGGGKGNVFVSRKRRVTQRAPIGKRRCCITHVGVICDQTDIQPRLPQVLIGNEFTFQAGAIAALRASSPSNVVLLRQKSAWNNHATCAWIIRRIGLALAPYAGRYQPVLLLDASRVHSHRIVLTACHLAGIWVVLIPALLTWLLQPLDTHGFQRYNAHMRKEYQEARIRSEGGDLAVGDFLLCVHSAVRSVLQGIPWSSAFDRDGFGARQAEVAPRILEKLERAGQVVAPLIFSRPTDAELALCFPRRTKVPVALLWRPFDTPPRAVPGAASSGCGAVAPCAARPPHREPRTRAEHRAAAAAAAPSATAASSSSSATPAAAARAPPASRRG